MSFTERVLETLSTVSKMNDKVSALAEMVKTQQTKIETLTERVIRLEATLELLMRVGEKRRLTD